MPDWTASMQQTFEYYTVDPGTWKEVRKLECIKSCSITRDLDTETLGSATFDTTEWLDECYVRVYLITIQNGIKEKHPLGTFLVQTPSTSFDGKISSMSMDAYTPLLELKENPPPIGYALFKDDNIMEKAYLITREHVRAPVVKTENSENLYSDFVSNSDDTWMKFVSDLIANAKYNFALDEMGRVLFMPKQETASLQPVWTFDDSNSSILSPDISLRHDLYGVPNVVEVIYSNGGVTYNARVVNDDSNSPISTISRGREIIYRETNPKFTGEPTEYQVKQYAEQLLKELSTVEYSVSYTHGYCPVRIGDCVRLNYSKAGFNGVKAKVKTQNIKCEPGCPVSETAVYTTKLWR